MKKIQIVCSGIVLVVISSLAQAVELSLNTSDGRSGELKRRYEGGNRKDYLPRHLYKFSYLDE